MRLFNRKIADTFVGYANGAGEVLNLELTGPLTQVDRIAFQLIVDRVTGTTPSMVFYAYNGNNGGHWPNSPSIISTGTLPTNTTSVFNGTLTFTAGGCAFLYLVLYVYGTNPGMRVKLYACGRGSRRKAARE